MAAEWRPCGADAFSYGVVGPLPGRHAGRYAVGPQTLCARLSREHPRRLGPIGIVGEIDPLPVPPRATPPPRPPRRPRG